MPKFVDRPPAIKHNQKDQRAALAAHNAAVRAAIRDIPIRKPKNPRRRAALKRNIIKALQTYFPYDFPQKFTPQRTMMAKAIMHAAQYGGDQAIAAPRGEGKTTITECVTLLCVLWGFVRFPVIVGATGHDAERILRNIKERCERDEYNDLLLEDFPEIDCILQLEGKAQRAHGQTAGGERTHIRWSGQEVVFPMYAGAISSGAIIATRGLDAAIRGLKMGATRPDLVIIDDPETRESAASEAQIDKRALIIEEDLGGLGGPGKRIARIMLTTLMRRECLSATYTDPKKKPWQGKRLKLIETWPKREDLWEQYLEERQANKADGDPLARDAHQFYLDNRKEMDKGSKVANPLRFIDEALPDGSKQEASALQHSYNIIADRGLNAFKTEYQNDPPEEDGPIESGITPFRIYTQLNGLERRRYPNDCVAVTQGIDVGKNVLHWVVRAWLPDATGYTIDYGVHEVYGTVYGSDEGLDQAVYRAILDRMEVFNAEEYCSEDGEILDQVLTLVDAGWRTDAVYAACYECGIAVKPVMGAGQSAGNKAVKFSEWQRTTTEKRPGDGWFLTAKNKGKVWLVVADADRWKAWEHDRWMTAPENGGLTAWGTTSLKGKRLSDDSRQHFTYARHITNEIEVEEPDPKKGLVRRWMVKSRTNHWLDASYYSNVAASMLGVRMKDAAPIGRQPKVVVTKEKKRKSLAELMARR